MVDRCSLTVQRAELCIKERRYDIHARCTFRIRGAHMHYFNKSMHMEGEVFIGFTSCYIQ